MMRRRRRRRRGRRRRRRRRRRKMRNSSNAAAAAALSSRCDKMPSLHESATCWRNDGAHALFAIVSSTAARIAASDSGSASAADWQWKESSGPKSGAPPSP
jgi:hypothetical protein